MTKADAMIERIAIYGHCSPAIAAQALQITADAQTELQLALMHVEDQRHRRRLIQMAASLLKARISELMNPKEILQ